MTEQSDAQLLGKIEELIERDSFWEQYRARLRKVVQPVFISIFLAGAKAALRQDLVREILARKVIALKAEAASEDLPLPSDFDRIIASTTGTELSEIYRRTIDEITTDFLEDLSESSYNQVKRAVDNARVSGGGVEEVIRALQRIYSPNRANAIAVTETTRLMGRGAQATYAAMELPGWEWLTVEDPWVCSICGALNGQQFPIEYLFEPAHTRCRCFIMPIDEYMGQSVPSRTSQYADEDFIELVEFEVDRRMRADSALLKETLTSPKEQEAIGYYQRSGYYAVNGSLRGVVDTNWLVEASIPQLDSAFARSRISDNYKVFRGVNNHVRDTVLSNVYVGDTIEDPAFLSTSFIPKVAREFGLTVLEIRVPAGTPAVFPDQITNNSSYTSEYELILPRSSSIKLVKVNEDRTHYVFDYVGIGTGQ